MAPLSKINLIYYCLFTTLVSGSVLGTPKPNNTKTDYTQDLIDCRNQAVQKYPAKKIPKVNIQNGSSIIDGEGQRALRKWKYKPKMVNEDDSSPDHKSIFISCLKSRGYELV